MRYAIEDVRRITGHLNTSVNSLLVFMDWDEALGYKAFRAMQYKHYGCGTFSYLSPSSCSELQCTAADNSFSFEGICISI